MPLVPIRKGALAVEESGEGPPLLLIPGLGGLGSFWRAQVGPFSQAFRVIVHDHRGVGASPGEAVAASTAEMAQDVAELIEALGLERVSIVGHSTGGAIAQHLALERPERLERVVFSASWPGPSPLFLDTFALRRRVLTELGVDAYLMLGTLLAAPADWLQARFEGAEAYLAPRRERFPELARELTRLDAVTGHDLRARLPQIATPALAICAADDQLTPPAFSRETATLIPGAALEVLPSGGHFCPQTCPDLYNAKVLAFLSAGRTR
jgi:aminoacrylate hydrolase